MVWTSMQGGAASVFGQQTHCSSWGRIDRSAPVRYHLTQDIEEGGSAAVAANTLGEPLLAQRFCFFWGCVIEAIDLETTEV